MTTQTHTRKHAKDFKKFKSWLSEQVSNAEAMTLESNKDHLPELLEKNSQACVKIQAMLDDFTLHFQSNGKPRHLKKHHGKVGQRPDMVAVMVDLFNIDKLLSTFEALQDEVKPKYQQAYCETRLELEELTSRLLSHCIDYITPKESHKIDQIQEQEDMTSND